MSNPDDKELEEIEMDDEEYDSGDAADVETFCDFVRKEAHEAIEARDRGEFDGDADDDGVRN